MPYTVPTAADLQLRYAAFSAVGDEVIEYWITDAQRVVTTGWDEGDYAPGIIALAAHSMAMEGLGAGGVEGAVSGLAGLTGFRSGTFSASFSEASANASVAGGYGASRYGREFTIMLRRNRGGARLVCG